MIDSSGEIIYVGQSSTILNRLGMHQARTSWWGEVAAIEVESFETLEASCDRERELIRLLAPRHNKAENIGRALGQAERVLGREVTVGMIGAYVRSEQRRIERTPTCGSGVTIPAWVTMRRSEEVAVTLTQVYQWRKRFPGDFPKPVGVARKNAKLYEPEDLNRFLELRGGRFG